MNNNNKKSRIESEVGFKKKIQKTNKKWNLFAISHLFKKKKPKRNKQVFSVIRVTHIFFLGSASFFNSFS